MIGRGLRVTMTKFGHKSFKNEGCSAYISINKERRVAILSNVLSTRLRQGYANQLLQEIIEYADFHNYELVLHAQRFHYRNTNGLNNQQLVSFYQKFGFVIDPEHKERGYFMIRYRRNSL